MVKNINFIQDLDEPNKMDTTPFLTMKYIKLKIFK